VFPGLGVHIPGGIYPVHPVDREDVRIEQPGPQESRPRPVLQIQTARGAHLGRDRLAGRGRLLDLPVQRLRTHHLHEQDFDPDSGLHTAQNALRNRPLLHVDRAVLSADRDLKQLQRDLEYLVDLEQQDPQQGAPKHLHLRVVPSQVPLVRQPVLTYYGQHHQEDRLE